MRMSKSFSLFIAFLICFSFSYAQLKVGLSAGMTRNYMETNIANRPFTDYRPESGFLISIPVKYTFNNWFAAEVDLEYIQKNWQLTRSGYYNGVYEKARNHYIQVPLLANFRFGSTHLKGFLNLGVYAAYWGWGNRKGQLANPDDKIEEPLQFNNIFDMYRPYQYDEAFQFDGTRDRKLEWGTVIGLGLEYSITHNTSLNIEGRYLYALSDQQKKYMYGQIPRYSETYLLKIGVETNLKHLFK